MYTKLAYFNIRFFFFSLNEPHSETETKPNYTVMASNSIHLFYEKNYVK